MKTKQATNLPSSKLLTKPEAADHLGLTVRGVECLMKRRALAFSRLGNRTVRFRQRDLDAFIERNRVKAVGE